MFTSQSKSRLMQLRLQLQTTKNGNSSMVEYLQKMKTCADNLVVATHLVTDDDLVLYILGGLGQEYDDVVVSFIARADLISLFDLHGFLLNSGATHHLTNNMQNMAIRGEYMGSDQINVGMAKDRATGKVLLRGTLEHDLYRLLASQLIS
ncbi:hypothetical protein KY290_036371 [Solanum tuberosum]|uniref:Retrovirus-related Pol polyprotein from transposon TNT 1-94 n=1 Tax=Solanum tuberosum TaxID=4113 RepID=A0ABQ7TSH0_SOLTU|nr:hypothetical protein KY289_035889 [Solanum tuberosum]KAH0639070.1 hypothetical protein KY285_035656 [Solanum tuberosum]KAH0737666.1 hypothetical protein KY290_036371 [Solanum tuberosum]